MSELLNELKSMSLDWAVETLDADKLNDYEWSTAIDKKFAELIIKECIEAVETSDMKCRTYTTYDMSLVEGTKQRCVKNIKDKFGIRYN